jgi:hypothetical protein
VVSLRYRSLLEPGGALTWEMIKDSRLRGRARSEALDTASRGRGTLNRFACIAMVRSTASQSLVKKRLQEIPVVIGTRPCQTATVNINEARPGPGPGSSLALTHQAPILDVCSYFGKEYEVGRGQSTTRTDEAALITAT